MEISAPEQFLGLQVGEFVITQLVSCSNHCMVFYGTGAIPVVIKVSGSDGHSSIEREREVYKLLKGTNATLPLLWSGAIGDRKAIVIPRMDFQGTGGSDLQHVYTTIKSGHGKNGLRVQQFSRAALRCLRDLHMGGFVHGDIKPTHIVTDLWRVCLIDFQNCQTFVDHPALPPATVSPFYASPAALRGEPIGPRDDLISLCYVIWRLLGSNVSASVYKFTEYIHQSLWDSGRAILEGMKHTHLPFMFDSAPPVYQLFLQRVLELGPQEIPNYDELDQILYDNGQNQRNDLQEDHDVLDHQLLPNTAQPPPNWG